MDRNLFKQQWNLIDQQKHVDHQTLAHKLIKPKQDPANIASASENVAPSKLSLTQRENNEPIAIQKTRIPLGSTHIPSDPLLSKTDILRKALKGSNLIEESSSEEGFRRGQSVRAAKKAQRLKQKSPNFGFSRSKKS